MDAIDKIELVNKLMLEIDNELLAYANKLKTINDPNGNLLPTIRFFQENAETNLVKDLKGSRPFLHIRRDGDIIWEKHNLIKNYYNNSLDIISKLKSKD